LCETRQELFGSQLQQKRGYSAKMTNGEQRDKAALAIASGARRRVAPALTKTNGASQNKTTTKTVIVSANTARGRRWGKENTETYHSHDIEADHKRDDSKLGCTTANAPCQKNHGLIGSEQKSQIGSRREKYSG
jgi:hypothetical protein